MNRNDFDRQMERFLNGELSAAEEREFLDGIEGDLRMEKIVKADSVMRSAIRQDRMAIPADHSATRASVLSKLAASGGAASSSDAGGATPDGGAAGAGSTAGGAAGSAAAAGAGILGSLTAKLILAGATLAVAAGIYVASLAPRSTSGIQAPAPVPATAPAMPAETAPALIDEPRPAAPAQSSLLPSDTAQPARRTTEEPKRTDRSGSTSRGSAATRTGTAAATASEPSRPQTDARSTDSVAVRNNDAKVPIQLNPPK